MQATDLAPFADSLGGPSIYLFPQAPVVAGSGYGWWPALPRPDGPRGEPRDLADADPPGRAGARATLMSFLDALRAERGDKPLVLAGFSQGGMLACDLALHHRGEVDALALMSSSRIAAADWHPRWSALRDLPMLVSHGRRDGELAFAAGEALRDCAMQGGARVSWLPFDGGHEIPLFVWRGLRRLIRDAGQPAS